MNLVLAFSFMPSLLVQALGLLIPSTRSTLRPFGSFAVIHCCKRRIFLIGAPNVGGGQPKATWREGKMDDSLESLLGKALFCTHFWNFPTLEAVLWMLSYLREQGRAASLCFEVFPIVFLQRRPQTPEINMRTGSLLWPSVIRSTHSWKGELVCSERE